MNIYSSDPLLAAILRESLRLFIVLALPLSASVFVAGLLAAALQGLTRAHDLIIGYTLRAAAVLISSYLLYPAALEGFTRLIQLALSTR